MDCLSDSRSSSCCFPFKPDQWPATSNLVSYLKKICRSSPELALLIGWFSLSSPKVYSIDYHQTVDPLQRQFDQQSVLQSSDAHQMSHEWPRLCPPQILWRSLELNSIIPSLDRVSRYQPSSVALSSRCSVLFDICPLRTLEISVAYRKMTLSQLYRTSIFFHLV